MFFIFFYEIYNRKFGSYIKKKRILTLISIIISIVDMLGILLNKQKQSLF